MTMSNTLCALLILLVVRNSFANGARTTLSREEQHVRFAIGKPRFIGEQHERAVVPVSTDPMTLPQVDGSFVRLAIEYLRSGDDEILSKISETPAARHLVAHANRVALSDSTPTAIDFTRKILSRLSRSSSDIDDLEARLNWFETDRATQRRCWEEASSLLPATALSGSVLYLTAGYDIGVSVSATASLNLAHQHFVEDRRELVFYCVHEIHHAGFQKYHDLPRVADTKTTRDLVTLIRYLTTLEGSAVHAARKWREASGALERDADYVALLDSERMRKYELEYWKLYRDLDLAPVRPLKDTDWEIVERMSGGDRLWYRVGARMAEQIENSRGRAALIEALREGPDAFFECYSHVQHGGVHFRPSELVRAREQGRQVCCDAAIAAY